MNKYTWREGGPKPKIKAEVFAQELHKIVSGDDLKQAKPKTIVDAARSRTSPMHKEFDWNNKRAAEKHRIEHARKLVGALQIVVVETIHNAATSTRAYLSVVEQKQRGYVDQDRIVTDSDLRAQMIGQAKRDLESYVKRYASILAMAPYVPRLQEILDQMRDDIDRLALEATQRSPRRQAAQSSQSEAVAVG